MQKKPYSCPRCGGQTERIKRNRIDRFLSLWIALRRYRCLDTNSCKWEGLLREIYDDNTDTRYK